MRTQIYAGLGLFSLLIAWPAAADVDVAARERVELTVYNQDFALIHEQRSVDLAQGVNALRLEGVAAQVDPTSVRVRSTTAPDQLRILEQNYEFDLVSYGKLLDKYIGKEVELHETDEKTGDVRVRKATLLSSGYAIEPQPTGFGMRPAYQYISAGQPIYEIDGKIHTQAPGRLVLPSLPQGLILSPTLAWQLEAAKAGHHTLDLSYMTSGIKWTADYVALLDADDAQLDLTGWVTLDNRSGAAYPDATLKLIAGDVHVIQPPRVYAERMMMKGAADMAAPQFEERPFFEYHLYTLQRPTTVKDNEIKQVEFAGASGVAVRKRYVYDGFVVSPTYQGWDASSYRDRPDFGAQSQPKVWVQLEFQNTAANHLGIPLPKGRVRLYKRDQNGGQEFIGEDAIDHTPKDELVRLEAGNAFDLIGERKQTDFRVIEPGHVVDESFDIAVRNHGERDARVTIREHLTRGRDFEIRNPSQPFGKVDAQTIEFDVPVPKNGRGVVSYTVRYRW